jgi:hypothetical protein
MNASTPPAGCPGSRARWAPTATCAGGTFQPGSRYGNAYSRSPSWPGVWWELWSGSEAGSARPERPARPGRSAAATTGPVGRAHSRADRPRRARRGRLVVRARLVRRSVGRRGEGRSRIGAAGDYRAYPRRYLRQHAVPLHDAVTGRRRRKRRQTRPGGRCGRNHGCERPLDRGRPGSAFAGGRHAPATLRGATVASTSGREQRLVQRTGRRRQRPVLFVLLGAGPAGARRDSGPGVANLSNGSSAKYVEYVFGWDQPEKPVVVAWAPVLQPRRRRPEAPDRPRGGGPRRRPKLEDGGLRHLPRAGGPRSTAGQHDRHPGRGRRLDRVRGTVADTERSPTS